MKIAEGLMKRADLQKKISELRERSVDSLYQSENEESEDVVALLEQADEIAMELELLVRSVNETNLATSFEVGEFSGTLADALARRETLKTQHKTLSEVLDSASPSYRRRRFYDDKPYGSLTVDVKILRKKADKLSAELRKLDVAIQQTNWNTDLLWYND